MELTDALNPAILLSSVIYTLLGLVLFGASLWIAAKIAPFSIRKEIEEDQNTSLGIMLGAMFIGIAILYILAVMDVKAGRRTWFQRHPVGTWIFVFFWMVSVTTGEAIFVMQYGPHLF